MSCLSAGVKELRRLQALPFADKIQRTKQTLRWWEKKYNHCGVSVSGGKASTVLAHLYLSTWPREKLSFWFGDTRLELPETYSFLRQLDAEWNLDLHWIRTPHSPWAVFSEFGWPVGGKRRHNWPTDAKARAHIGSECCRLLKHGPLDRAHKDAGIKVIGLGMQASESTQRRINWVEFGEEHTRKKDNMTRLQPLGIWTDEDIWAYHEAFRIPHSQVYDMGYRRNGCWACGMDISFADSGLWQLEKSHPKHFATLMRKGMGEVINAYRLACVADGKRRGGAAVKRLPDRHGCFHHEVGDQEWLDVSPREGLRSAQEENSRG